MNGQHLKQAITRAGLNQANFADKIGVSTNTVWRWIKGDINPTDDKKQKISELLGVSMAYLMGGRRLQMKKSPLI